MDRSKAVVTLSRPQERHLRYGLLRRFPPVSDNTRAFLGEILYHTKQVTRFIVDRHMRVSRAGTVCLSSHVALGALQFLSPRAGQGPEGMRM
jgi:hypothetical protein